jgi:hypothetical protein
VIPAIFWVFCHLAPDLIEGIAVGVEFKQELPKAVVATLHFAVDVGRDS